MTAPDTMPTGTMSGTPQLLLAHHLKQLKLPTDEQPVNVRPVHRSPPDSMKSHGCRGCAQSGDQCGTPGGVGHHVHRVLC